MHISECISQVTVALRGDIVKTMSSAPAQRLRCWSFIAVLACAFQSVAPAELIPVRHKEGTVHGFLVLRAEDGRELAVGDLFQIIRGNQVTSRLLFRFKDGSIDDEVTVFSQRGNFRLITDHHVQKGPSYPHPMDMSIDARSGQVTVRSPGKDGKEEVTTDHIDMPPDISNGLILSLAKNILPETPETKVSMIVATPKPRLVTLAISPHGKDPFSIAGSIRKATHYVIKIEIGGIAGKVAPLIGKQPHDIQIWILGGIAPSFVKEEGQLYQGGPDWSIQLTSPVWPHASDSGSK
jgi:hypothetical protein